MSSGFLLCSRQYSVKQKQYLYNVSARKRSSNRLFHSSSIKFVKVQVKDAQINYETTGVRGKVALCLPGSMGSIYTDFRPQLKSLGSKGIEAIFWDPPGYGESRPPDRNFSNNFFQNDAQYAAELMKTLGYDSYSLLGWSDGGITALCMALLFPKQIDKLVLWGANDHVSETDLKLYANVRDVSKWSDRMRQPMEQLYGVEYFHTKWAEWCDAMERFYTQHGGRFYTQDTGSITAPTLIIHGKKDAMVGEEHAMNLHNKIKGSRLVMWENGKHNLHLKYSQDFNNLVAEFLHE